MRQRFPPQIGLPLPTSRKSGVKVRNEGLNEGEQVMKIVDNARPLPNATAKNRLGWSRMLDRTG